MPQIELGGNNYNVFVDVAGADIILAGDVLRAAPWALRDEEAKKRGLISATRILTNLTWCGEVPAFDAAPEVVKDVNAMLASDLLSKPKLFADASANSNIKTVKGGSAMVEFFRPVDGSPPIPLAMWTMLANAGLVGCVDIDSGENAGAIVTGISEGVRPLGGRWPWEYPIAAEDHD